MQSVPYWIDDESVRDSVLASSPAPMATLNQAALERGKPRADLDGHVGVAPGPAAPSTHPLLGDRPTLQLIQDRRSSGARLRAVLRSSLCMLIRVALGWMVLS